MWGSRVRSHLFPSEFAFTLTLLQWLLYYFYFKSNYHFYLFLLLYFSFSNSAFFCTTMYLVLLKNLQLLMFSFKPVSFRSDFTFTLRLLRLCLYYLCYRTNYYHRLFFCTVFYLNKRFFSVPCSFIIVLLCMTYIGNVECFFSPSSVFTLHHHSFTALPKLYSILLHYCVLLYVI